MSIKKAVLTYLKNNKNRFKNDYQLRELYLFGSVARAQDTSIR